MNSTRKTLRRAGAVTPTTLATALMYGGCDTKDANDVVVSFWSNFASVMAVYGSPGDLSNGNDRMQKFLRDAAKMCREFDNYLNDGVMDGLWRARAVVCATALDDFALWLATFANERGAA